MIKRTITHEGDEPQVETLRDMDLHNSPMGDLFRTWPALEAITLEVGGSDRNRRQLRFERIHD